MDLDRGRSPPKAVPRPHCLVASQTLPGARTAAVGPRPELHRRRLVVLAGSPSSDFPELRRARCPDPTPRSEHPRAPPLSPSPGRVPDWPHGAAPRRSPRALASPPQRPPLHIPDARSRSPRGNRARPRARAPPLLAATTATAVPARDLVLPLIGRARCCPSAGVPFRRPPVLRRRPRARRRRPPLRPLGPLLGRAPRSA